MTALLWTAITFVLVVPIVYLTLSLCAVERWSDKQFKAAPEIKIRSEK